MIATTEQTAALDAESNETNFNTPAPARSVVRVWLTDDNAGIRVTLNELLDRTGEFDCERQCASAEELLRALASGEPHPDVILLDVEMGGLSGVDALRPIRALAPTVRVLIMTAFFDPIYETKALRGGASAFMVKSYAFQRIVEEIHRAVTRPVPTADFAVVGAKPVVAAARPVARAAGVRGCAGATSRGWFPRARLWLAQILGVFKLGPLPRPTAALE